MDRVILHCDCNSFFASVETALNPSYKNVPMAVCGSVADRHGIVLAKNELAKKYGIETAETVGSAQRKCPNLVIASPHYEEYVEYSKKVCQIYGRYTDMVESFGIDECWLDVTASEKLFGDGMQIAERIREEVKTEIGITVSIGVSFNKVFAKFGSDYKKPDAITRIGRDNYREIIYPRPASSLLFVGKKTAEELKKLGVITIGDLAEYSEDLMIKRFGKMGECLHRYASGEDDSPVCPNEDKEEAKSISNGYTFPQDLSTFEECKREIDYLIEDIAAKLRKHGWVASTVSVKLKDPFLKVFQKQQILKNPTNLSRDISECAYSVFTDMWESGKPVRQITIGVSGLFHEDFKTEQITFFQSKEDDAKKEKNIHLDDAVDGIREKFGKKAIYPAVRLHK